jgi:hypothetical protein
MIISVPRLRRRAALGFVVRDREVLAGGAVAIALAAALIAYRRR